MSDLYVPDVADCGHQNCTRANIDYLSEYAHKASRSDVLEWLGWEKCGTCGGYGVVPEEAPRGSGLDSMAVECYGPCADGLVPPASQVEAAAFPILDTLAMSWHKQLRISHEEAMQREDFKLMATTVARAALIASLE